MKLKTAKFIKSILDWRDGPQPALPEIAFVGRSNVGKSSLVNCLLNKKNFARVSKQPGKTRTINYFLINEAFYLVDLPGYGFAKTSKAEQLRWQQAIEGYLLNSPQLQMLFVLLDSKVGPKTNDVQLAEWLQFNQVPYRIISTKVDKISKNARAKAAATILHTLNLDPQTPILFFSAKDRTGRPEVLDTLAQIVK